MKDTIGFIGLGQLGLPMAANLLDAGHPLRVYNRTAAKTAPLVARGAQAVSQPADAVTPGGVVVSVLWDDASVESIASSPGFLERLGPGGVHVSMSTILPEAAQRLAALHAKHGVAYVAAPVFGRPEAAVAKRLWVPVAGPADAKQRVRPLLDAMGAAGVFDFGDDVGAATVVKLAGNFLIGAAVRSLAEAVGVAEANGVDPKALVEMLTSTLFTAPIYQSYGKMLVEKTAPFGQSAIVMKDLGLYKRTAQRVEAPTPLADRLRELIESAPPATPR